MMRGQAQLLLRQVILLPLGVFLAVCAHGHADFMPVCDTPMGVSQTAASIYKPSTCRRRHVIAAPHLYAGE
jgi:hypothetical protein